MIPAHVRLGMILALLIVALDQASKWWVVETIMRPPRIIPVTEFFNLVLGLNQGVSFGMLDMQSPMGRWILSGLALAITAALYTGLPWIDQQLEALCKDHPWENCTDQVPKIEETMRSHLHLVRSISLSICIFIMGILHASFLAVSESRRSAYEQIPSYNKPTTNKQTPVQFRAKRFPRREKGE